MSWAFYIQSYDNEFVLSSGSHYIALLWKALNSDFTILSIIFFVVVARIYSWVYTMQIACDFDWRKVRNRHMQIGQEFLTLSKE